MSYSANKRTARAILGSAASTLVLGALIQAGMASAAYAQQQPPKPPAAAAADEGVEVEQVVVTGTFLRGTPATAVIPVEGVNLEEIRDRGSPSATDFIKGLSEVGSIVGEANRVNTFAIGAQTVNLRGLGPGRTVVVFNGRRFPETFSFSSGRFNNIAQIPSAAIGRTEVLKDGGATTYGADAVGGVVNYITRRNLNGIEATANYRYIKDSDGDYDFSISAGKVYDNFNVMGVISYEARSALYLRDRDFTLTSYLINPSPWSFSANPGAFSLQTPSGATFTGITPNATGANLYTGELQMGPTGVLRDPGCLAMGGFAGFSTTPSPVCYNRYYDRTKLSRIGDLGLVTVAGETLVELGLGVKKASPFEKTIFLGYSNGCISYIPPADAYPPEGWSPWETYSIPDMLFQTYQLPMALSPKCGDMIVGRCVELLNGLAASGGRAA